MTARYRIEPYRDELRRDLVGLQAHHWSPNEEINERYFHWKYEANPYLDRPLIYVAVDERNRVAGMRGAYGASWIDESGARLPALGAGDLVVHPEHRNRYLPRKIMEACAADLGEKGYLYLVNLSASPFTRLASIRQGWKLVAEHRPARHTPSKARIRSWIRRRVGMPAEPREPHPFAAFDAAAARAARRRPAALAIEHESRPGAMARLCATSERGVRHARDEAFFQWRFRNPLSEYRFLYWQESDELLAYLVLGEPVAEPGRATAWVDWAHSCTAAFEGLVRTALELLAPGASFVWLGTASKDEIALLSQNGFIERDQDPSAARRPGLLVKHLDSPAAGDSTPGAHEELSWHYRMIDSDGV